MKSVDRSSSTNRRSSRHGMSTAVSVESRIANVEVTDETIVAHLVDGRVISVPLAWSWRLSDATPAQRANWQLIGDGHGVHWPDVDEDISAEGMLSGIPAHRPRTHSRTTAPANRAYLDSHRFDKRLPLMAYRFTAYFENEVLRKRPYLTKEMCMGVVERALRVEPQERNRYRFWAPVPDLGDGYVRVLPWYLTADTARGPLRPAPQSPAAQNLTVRDVSGFRRTC
jgi:hypothetical protein